MSLDRAGNYLFSISDSIDDNDYRVRKMNVFEQRAFLGIISKAFIDVEEIIIDEDGNEKLEKTSSLDLYSDECNKAEDYLMDRTQVRYEGTWTFLTSSELMKHLASIEGRPPLMSLNRIFTEAVSVLLENFTGTGAEVSLTNSNQAQEEESGKTGLEKVLSVTSN